MGAGVRDFVVLVASLIVAAVAFTELERAKLNEARARHVLTLPDVPLRCISDSSWRVHQLETDVTRDFLHANSCAVA